MTTEPAALADATVEVASAHVRAAQRLGAAGRSRVRAVLRGARLAPPGLASDAVLLVRRVEMMLPATALAPWGAGPRQRRWETDARGRLVQVMDAAARPADGSVPATADAVLFCDRAELLACLAKDLVRGVAASRWWWRIWLGSSTRGVADVLGDDVPLLPAVLDTLHGWGAAVEVVAAVPPPAAERLLQALAARFELPVPSAGAGPNGVHPGRRERDPPAVSSAAPPWSSALGPTAVPSDLAPQQAALLAVALVLTRSPRHVRTAPMRDLLVRPERAWDPVAGAGWTVSGSDGPGVAAGEVDGSEPGSGVAAARPDVGSPTDHGAAAAAGHGGGASSAAASQGDDAVGGVGRDPGQASTPSTRAAPAGPAGPAGHEGAVVLPATRLAPGSDDPLGARRHASTPWAERDDTSDGGADRVDGADRAGDAEPEQPRRSTSPPGGVATQLAGVWYLINVVRALELPDVVDPAWRLDQLTGWALVELLARALLDHAATDDGGLGDDPLWSLLAELDGRDPGDPVGVALDPPHPPFRLPESWADDARAHGGPAVAPADDADDADDAPPGPLTSLVTPATAAWLRGARPYLRWRLAAALDDGDPSEVLRVPGRLHLTRTHLDVVVPLAAASLPARVAGLDRDPGWVPRLGRVVSFRFVEETVP